jgi:hypothetical protein
MKNVTFDIPQPKTVEERLELVNRMAHCNLIEGNPLTLEEKAYIERVVRSGIPHKEFLKLVKEAAKQTIDPSGKSSEIVKFFGKKPIANK